MTRWPDFNGPYLLPHDYQARPSQVYHSGRNCNNQASASNYASNFQGQCSNRKKKKMYHADAWCDNYGDSGWSCYPEKSINTWENFSHKARQTKRPITHRKGYNEYNSWQASGSNSYRQGNGYNEGEKQSFPMTNEGYSGSRTFSNEPSKSFCEAGQFPGSFNFSKKCKFNTFALSEGNKSFNSYREQPPQRKLTPVSPKIVPKPKPYSKKYASKKNCSPPYEGSKARKLEVRVKDLPQAKMNLTKSIEKHEVNMGAEKVGRDSAHILEFEQFITVDSVGDEQASSGGNEKALLSAPKRLKTLSDNRPDGKASKPLAKAAVVITAKKLYTQCDNENCSKQGDKTSMISVPSELETDIRHDVQHKDAGTESPTSSSLDVYEIENLQNLMDEMIASGQWMEDVDDCESGSPGLIESVYAKSGSQKIKHPADDEKASKENESQNCVHLADDEKTPESNCQSENREAKNLAEVSNQEKNLKNNPNDEKNSEKKLALNDRPESPSMCCVDNSHVLRLPLLIGLEYLVVDKTHGSFFCNLCDGRPTKNLISCCRHLKSFYHKANYVKQHVKTSYRILKGSDAFTPRNICLLCNYTVVSKPGKKPIAVDSKVFQNLVQYASNRYHILSSFGPKVFSPFKEARCFFQDFHLKYTSSAKENVEIAFKPWAAKLMNKFMKEFKWKSEIEYFQYLLDHELLDSSPNTNTFFNYRKICSRPADNGATSSSPIKRQCKSVENHQRKKQKIDSVHGAHVGKYVCMSSAQSFRKIIVSTSSVDAQNTLNKEKTLLTVGVKKPAPVSEAINKSSKEVRQMMDGCGINCSTANSKVIQKTVFSKAKPSLPSGKSDNIVLSADKVECNSDKIKICNDGSEKTLCKTSSSVGQHTTALTNKTVISPLSTKWGDGAERIVSRTVGDENYLKGMVSTKNLTLSTNFSVGKGSENILNEVAKTSQIETINSTKQLTESTKPPINKSTDKICEKLIITKDKPVVSNADILTQAAKPSIDKGVTVAANKHKVISGSKEQTPSTKCLIDDDTEKVPGKSLKMSNTKILTEAFAPVADEATDEICNKAVNKDKLKPISSTNNSTKTAKASVNDAANELGIEIKSKLGSNTEDQIQAAKSVVVVEATEKIDDKTKPASNTKNLGQRTNPLIHNTDKTPGKSVSIKDTSLDTSCTNNLALSVPNISIHKDTGKIGDKVVDKGQPKPPSATENFGQRTKPLIHNTDKIPGKSVSVKNTSLGTSSTNNLTPSVPNISICKDAGKICNKVQPKLPSTTENFGQRTKPLIRNTDRTPGKSVSAKDTSLGTSSTRSLTPSVPNISIRKDTGKIGDKVVDKEQPKLPSTTENLGQRTKPLNHNTDKIPIKSVSTKDTPLGIGNTKAPNPSVPSISIDKGTDKASYKISDKDKQKFISNMKNLIKTAKPLIRNTDEVPEKSVAAKGTSLGASNMKTLTSSVSSISMDKGTDKVGDRDKLKLISNTKNVPETAKRLLSCNTLVSDKPFVGKYTSLGTSVTKPLTQLNTKMHSSVVEGIGSASYPRSLIPSNNPVLIPPINESVGNGSDKVDELKVMNSTKILATEGMKSAKKLIQSGDYSVTKSTDKTGNNVVGEDNSKIRSITEKIPCIKAKTVSNTKNLAQSSNSSTTEVIACLPPATSRLSTVLSNITESCDKVKPNVDLHKDSMKNSSNSKNAASLEQKGLSEQMAGPLKATVVPQSVVTREQKFCEQKQHCIIDLKSSSEEDNVILYDYKSCSNPRSSDKSKNPNANSGCGVEVGERNAFSLRQVNSVVRHPVASQTVDQDLNMTLTKNKSSSGNAASSPMVYDVLSSADESDCLEVLDSVARTNDLTKCRCDKPPVEIVNETERWQSWKREGLKKKTCEQPCFSARQSHCYPYPSNPKTELESKMNPKTNLTCNETTKKDKLRHSSSPPSVGNKLYGYPYPSYPKDAVEFGNNLNCHKNSGIVGETEHERLHLTNEVMSYDIKGRRKDDPNYDPNIPSKRLGNYAFEKSSVPCKARNISSDSKFVSKHKSLGSRDSEQMYDILMTQLGTKGVPEAKKFHPNVVKKLTAPQNWSHTKKDCRSTPNHRILHKKDSLSQRKDIGKQASDHRKLLQNERNSSMDCSLKEKLTWKKSTAAVVRQSMHCYVRDANIEVERDPRIYANLFSEQEKELDQHSREAIKSPYGKGFIFETVSLSERRYAKNSYLYLVSLFKKVEPIYSRNFEKLKKMKQSANFSMSVNLSANSSAEEKVKAGEGLASALLRAGIPNVSSDQLEIIVNHFGRRDKRPADAASTSPDSTVDIPAGSAEVSPVFEKSKSSPPADSNSSFGASRTLEGIRSPAQDDTQSNEGSSTSALAVLKETLSSLGLNCSQATDDRGRQNLFLSLK